MDEQVQEGMVMNVNLYKVKLKIWLMNFSSFLRDLMAHRAAFLGAVIVLICILAAVLAPRIAPHNPFQADSLRLRLLPPFWARGENAFQILAKLGKEKFSYLLGCDELGRDLLSRIIYGARASLLVGVLAVGISTFVGVSLGAIAGYYRGWFDNVFSRFADLLLAFPYLIFAIFIMAVMGPGFSNLIFALTLKGWVEFFRLVRGEMLSEKTKEYVDAAKVTGQSKFIIIFFEILPNIIHTVIVLATLRMGYMIIMEASLSFLGLGIQPPTPAWGSMVNAGRAYMLNAWWVSTFPGLFMLVLVLSINLLGEGLRDILDPRLKID